MLRLLVPCLLIYLGACSLKHRDQLRPIDSDQGTVVCGGDGQPIEGASCDITFDTQSYRFIIEDHPESSSGDVTVSDLQTGNTVYSATLARQAENGHVLYTGENARILVYRLNDTTMADVDLDANGISVHETQRPALLSGRLVATLNYVTDGVGALVPVTQPVTDTLSQVVGATGALLENVTVLGTNSDGVTYVEALLPDGTSQVFATVADVTKPLLRIL